MLLPVLWDQWITDVRSEPRTQMASSLHISLTFSVTSSEVIRQTKSASVIDFQVSENLPQCCSCLDSTLSARPCNLGIEIVVTSLVTLTREIAVFQREREDQRGFYVFSL